MAEIGTATVKVTPVIDEDALANLDTAVREAVAEALRKVADSLVAKPTGAVAQPEPRYYVQQINGIWGVRDRQVEGEWAAFDEYDSSDADETAASLNAGESRSAWDWTATGTY